MRTRPREVPVRASGKRCGLAIKTRRALGPVDLEEAVEDSGWCSESFVFRAWGSSVSAANDRNLLSFLRPNVAESPANEAPAERSRSRGFSRVPTHAIGVATERRLYPRAALRLPLQVRRVAGQTEAVRGSLLTRDISSSGVYFLCPERIEPGTPVEMEISIIQRPFGRGSVRMRTEARIVRVESAGEGGWHGLAAEFEDISFYRDDAFPPGFSER